MRTYRKATIMTNNSFPPVPSDEFIQNIEEAIQEHGTIACPNPRCFDKLVSKKKWNANLGKTIEYGCRNPSCHYHVKRQIFLHDVEEVKVKKNTSLNIMGITVVIMLTILSYVSYHLYSLNRYIEGELENIETFAQEIEQKTFGDKEKVNTKTAYPSQNIALKSEKALPAIDLSNLYTKAELFILAGNFVEGKKYFEKFLEDEYFANVLLEDGNKAIRQKFILLIGDSYQKYSPQFSYYLLKTQTDFELLTDFISTFDTQGDYRNILLGKAFLNAPNFLTEKIDLRERKRMQLQALRFYLTALKEDFLGDYHRSTLNAIQEISKLYRIFEFNPSQRKGYPTFEQLFVEDNQVELQNRIDYLDRIIRKI
ncbi:MAG: hypothetical protein AAF573_02430 [Bacteroidota bacterium]